VHIRDNLELKPSAYRIALKGVEVGAGEAMNGQYLAINPGMVSGRCRVWKRLILRLVCLRSGLMPVRANKRKRWVTPWLMPVP
jgi:hypothetical protein